METLLATARSSVPLSVFTKGVLNGLLKYDVWRRWWRWCRWLAECCTSNRPFLVSIGPSESQVPKSVPPTCRMVRCRTVPRTCHARIDHTHSLVSGRTERWPSRNAEGFRRTVWLALWRGMICQVRGGEPYFATTRYWQVDLSCFHRQRSMASGAYTESRTSPQ
jgi:hypothetical protein